MHVNPHPRPNVYKHVVAHSKADEFEDFDRRMDRQDWWNKAAIVTLVLVGLVLCALVWWG